MAGIHTKEEEEEEEGEEEERYQHVGGVGGVDGDALGEEDADLLRQVVDLWQVRPARLERL